jgi:hypothetical protein
MRASSAHSSWVSSAGLVLMGGLGRGMYAEIVNVPSGDGDFSLVKDTAWYRMQPGTEILTCGNCGDGDFSLVQDTV